MPKLSNKNKIKKMSKLSNKNKQVKENKKRRNTKRKVGGANNTVSKEQKKIKRLKKLLNDYLQTELLWLRAIDSTDSKERLTLPTLQEEMRQLKKKIDSIKGQLPMSEEDKDKITKEALKGTENEQLEIKDLMGRKKAKEEWARAELLTRAHTPGYEAPPGTFDYGGQTNRYTRDCYYQ